MRGINPRDREAARGADVSHKPSNLEEKAQEDADEAAAVETPTLTDRILDTARSVVHGRCDFCDKAALPDPRGTHKCARCRSVMTQEYAARRAKERAAAKAALQEKEKR